MMAYSLNNLINLVPPPGPHRVPFHVRDSEWRKIEEQLGITFPDDYKQLVQYYGVGQWCEFLINFSPLSPNRYANQIPIVYYSFRYMAIYPGPPYSDPWVVAMWAKNIEQAHALREESPFPYYPEAGGLFPWGEAKPPEGQDKPRNVDVYWLTTGPPSKWPIIVRDGQQEGPSTYARYNMSTVSFLYSWLSGKLDVQGFPSKCDRELLYRNMEYYHITHDHTPWQAQEAKLTWGVIGNV